MDSLIKIGFVGNKTEDILLYISRILLKLDNKVAIFDMSEEQLLKYSVPSIDEKADFASYRNVDFYSFRRCVDNSYKEEFKKYDIVLLNFGYYKCLLKDFVDCDHKFLVTDLEKHSVLKLKETVLKIENQVAVNRIFRDVVDCKIGQNYIDNLLHSGLVENLTDFVFYLDDTEMICRLESQYNDIFKFNKLPKSIKLSLLEMVQLMGFDKKRVIKALKVAEKGV